MLGVTKNSYCIGQATLKCSSVLTVCYSTFKNGGDSGPKFARSSLNSSLNGNSSTNTNKSNGSSFDSSSTLRGMPSTNGNSAFDLLNSFINKANKEKLKKSTSVINKNTNKKDGLNWSKNGNSN